MSVQPIKILSILFLAVFASACSTLSRNNGATESVAVDQATTAIARADSLELEVARLKSDNARMANQLMELQRENDSLKDEGFKDQNAIVSLLRGGDAPAPDPSRLAGNRAPDKGPIVTDQSGAGIAGSNAPVASAPRLVQPTFASTDTVFENEAADTIETASVLYGVHLASYRRAVEAREGWRVLQRTHPDELGLLEPRLESVSIPDKGLYLRLIGGGFSSQEKAMALCANLKQEGTFCTVSGFNGERLSLTE